MNDPTTTSGPKYDIHAKFNIDLNVPFQNYVYCY